MDFKTKTETMNEVDALQLHVPGAAHADADQQREQYLTLFLCMLHGIEVTWEGRADTEHWSYHKNGILTNNNIIDELLKQHGKDDADLLKHNVDMCKNLVENFDANREHCKDLEYNLHLLYKPAFEAPNPLILCTIMQDISSNVVVPIGTEGRSACDKDDLHHFKKQYLAYVDEDKDDFQEQTTDMKSVFTDLFQMYNELTGHMCATNPTVPASTYIQNNQTELPAMAYHGNLTMQRSNGVRDEVRCVGHLGNSFPGCASIREGKGMVNMYETMPRGVHVM
jgi:hypothetical protein